MISISHMPSPSLFSIISIFSSTFLLSFVRSISKFWWHFSSSLSTFGDRRSVSLKFWPVLSRFVVLASWHPHYRLIGRNSFIPIRSISWILFFVILRRPSFQNTSSFSVFNFALPIFFIDVSSFVSIFLRWFFQDYSSVVIVLIHSFFS